MILRPICLPSSEWLKPAARQAYISLDTRDSRDYGKVKAAILQEDGISPEIQRQRFRQFCYHDVKGPQEVYSQLQDLLVLEQFLTILPEEILPASAPQSSGFLPSWGPGFSPAGLGGLGLLPHGARRL
uniref:SCAN box domain-containing protein n=1 Tax=Terrapene triunguis TaxID=2587831 RepID=A0A674I3X1_9SAUR